MDLQSRILVVDDDADLRKLIGDYLRGHGYIVESAANVTALRQAMQVNRPDVIILDIMMPGEDGLSAARSIAVENGPAVIILSALGSDTDRIVGLEIGADDYLAKPCNPRELLARVRVALRRRQGPAPADGSSRVFEFAGWRIDAGSRVLRDPSGVFVELSDGEFALLRNFVEHPQRVLTRDQLLDLANRGERDIYDRAIDSQISRLRRKLQLRDGTELIRTVRNEGYMFTAAVRRA